MYPKRSFVLSEDDPVEATLVPLRRPCLRRLTSAALCSVLRSQGLPYHQGQWPTLCVTGDRVLGSVTQHLDRGNLDFLQAFFDRFDLENYISILAAIYIDSGC